MLKLFTDDNAWSGGFYELMFRLHESMDPQKALSILWNRTELEGCYLDHTREPSEQEKVSPLGASYQGHWYGLATLPNKKQCAAGSFWGEYDNIGVWLTFYIPIGSLGVVYSLGAFPFNIPATPYPESWMLEVNDWFRKIAEGVFPTLQFSLALIGYEVDFRVLEQLQEGIPTKRWEGILLFAENQLKWYPPTIYDPPYTVEKILK